MSLLLVGAAFPVFTDTDGQPLENGYIWIGQTGLDPIANPVSVYWDAAMTQPVTQPIRTRGGYPLNGASIGRLYVNSDYSILVRNRNGYDIYSSSNFTETFSSDYVAFTQSGTGAINRTVQNKFTESVSVKDFGAVGNGVADDTAEIQAAIDAVYLKGGGEVFFPVGKYIVSATIEVPQRVTLVGETPAFVNQYISNFAAPKGSVLFLKTGSNVNVVRFRCRLTNNAGVLEETTIGGRNSDARHFGGMRGIVVWGNRSLDQLPSVKDLNSAGDGIKIEGSRYVRIEDVTSMFCAGHGVSIGSYDYGLGAFPSNNQQFNRVTALSNSSNGFNIYGGDSTFTDLSSGYNALNGMVYGMSGTVNGGIFWNNGGHGVVADGITNTSSAAWNGLHSYDNDTVGFRLNAIRTPILNGCVARGNGRDAGATATERANFYVTSAAQGWSLSGCRSYARDQDNVLVTQYGFYINNLTYPGTVDGSTDEGSVTPYFIADGTKVIAHGGVTNTIPHPPLSVTGTIDLNGNSLNEVSSLRFSSWLTVSSITSGTITIANSTLFSLNFAAPESVTDLSFSTAGNLPLVIFRNITANAVTFVNNSSKLRLANGADVVLNQHESIMLVHISGAVWQQIGGAY